MKMNIMGHEVEVHQYTLPTQVDEIEVFEMYIDGHDVTGAGADGYDKQLVKQIVGKNTDKFLEEFYMYI